LGLLKLSAAWLDSRLDHGEKTGLATKSIVSRTKSSTHRRQRCEPCSHCRRRLQHRFYEASGSSAKGPLTTLDGTPASCLELAAGPKQVPRCVTRAFEGGINYFFFYGPGNTSFIEELAALGTAVGLLAGFRC
jgi:hypothetical protein